MKFFLKIRINFLAILLLPALLVQISTELLKAQEVRYEHNALIRIDSLSSGVILRPEVSSAHGFSSPVDGNLFSSEFERPEGLLRIQEMLSGCQECKLPAADTGYTIEEIENVLRQLLAERGIMINQNISESADSSLNSPTSNSSDATRSVVQRSLSYEYRISADKSARQDQTVDNDDTRTHMPESATAKEIKAEPIPTTPQVNQESSEEIIARIETDFSEIGKLTDQRVQFAYDSYELLPESFPLLNAIASYLLNNPDREILITGNTCTIGPLDYNYRLSELRAESVANYLLSNYPKIDADRISTEGRGPDNPIAKNDDPEVRYLNRRVEFIIKGER
ncbi:MAG: OmpA family protein [Bacteroidetes bacterium]|nr:OmpA family protein [Bacteroidota bacterium]